MINPIFIIKNNKILAERLPLNKQPKTEAELYKFSKSLTCCNWQSDKLDVNQNPNVTGYAVTSDEGGIKELINSLSWDFKDTSVFCVLTSKISDTYPQEYTSSLFCFDIDNQKLKENSQYYSPNIQADEIHKDCEALKNQLIKEGIKFKCYSSKGGYHFIFKADNIKTVLKYNKERQVDVLPKYLNVDYLQLHCIYKLGNGSIIHGDNYSYDELDIMPNWLKPKPKPVNDNTNNLALFKKQSMINQAYGFKNNCDLWEIVRDVNPIAVMENFGYYQKGGTGQEAQFLCPFHYEQVASFSVHIGGERNGVYYCHACGEKGNLITLIMRLAQIEFKDVANWIKSRV